MNKEPASSNAISEAVLRVCSREELNQMDKVSLSNLGHLIGHRLDRPGPPPTQDELQGIKELVTEHLWHPALSRLSEPSPNSATTNSKPSDSPRSSAAPSSAPLAPTSSARLPDAPKRESFPSQEEIEEALGCWQGHVGRIKGMVDRAQALKGSQKK